ncbi:MAG: NADH-quinone oxidoreductase subunit NuoE [Rickettsiaceae bacterium]
MTNNNNKFSFNKDNTQKAKEIVSKYPDDRQKSAVLPLLDLAQRQNNGWLSVDAIEYVADYISEPYMRVYEVASFYSMFYLQPVGKHHIQICGTTPCWLRGSAEILKACEDQIGVKCGNSSADGKFTISEVECLGACVNAPLVQINDDYYENLTAEKMRTIIDELDKKDSKKVNKSL